MTAVGATDSEFNDILTQASTHLAKVQTSAQSLYDSVSAIWDWIPPWLKDDVNRFLTRAWDIVKELFDYVKDFVLNPGWPPALFHAGEVWVDKVGLAASSAVGQTSLNYTQVDDHWQGDAATAYKNTLPAQGLALGAIKTMCDALDTALKNMAGAIVAFWLACIAGLLSALPEFGAEEAAADTGVGAPPAILAFIASVVKLLGIISGAAALLWAFSGSQIGPYTAMNQQLNNWNAFPARPGSAAQGNWPAATTPGMSDASFLDGNDSNWRFLS
ncbi:hypothetical protein [Paractinoplanes durhamensis]|uniref:Uncharacterized protein n=1 Tax=Paractinoplanes durhamensis TaxID=113563 RepID=A0ABQ3YVI4_9ACTN|nr:hypothetical protein [Actinoplanes durhamensis]GIE01537.1 hypothetical protein Adu01nite_28870 [Actinoplanes durhamensis]